MRHLRSEAVRLWVASRVGVALLVLATTWMVAETSAGNVASWLSRWDRWDVGLFTKVAHWGYQGYPQHYPDQGVVAFFPGEPLVLRAVHLLVPDWVAAGLLVSAVAGAFAVHALARLAAHEPGAGPTAGDRAVLYLVLSPYAVFLFAGYSEALFLAFALPAWLAARRHHWVLAGCLGGLAASVRITGVFLGAALLVEWLTAGGPRRGRDLPALLAPWAVTAAYFGYLHHITGSATAWTDAQRDYWNRRFTAPWTALHTTWEAATGGGQGAAYAWSFRAEIAAVLLGVVLTVVLLLARRWGEAVYVGGQVASLATSAYYLSVARASLLWWPLWLLLARWSLQRRWLHYGYLAVAPALMAAGVVAFTQGHWVG